jgi:iron complex outermembrane receptor protein
MEGITREQIERSINATDSEDALKYFPSLLVRKRYIGDYNHAILSSRASGTGNSARSLVYADGILLSNLLGNGVGGLSLPAALGPGDAGGDRARRRDVRPVLRGLSGQFGGRRGRLRDAHADQAGGHAKAAYAVQPFRLYGTDDHVAQLAGQRVAGQPHGDWSWWLNANRTDSEGQPLTFATRWCPAGRPAARACPVTGAVLAATTPASPGTCWAAAPSTHAQDHLKAKLAYDFTRHAARDLHAGLVAERGDGPVGELPAQRVRRAVTAGPIAIGGSTFAALNGADLPLTSESLTHVLHGLSLKTARRACSTGRRAPASTTTPRRQAQNAAGQPVAGAAAGGAPARWPTAAAPAGSRWRCAAPGGRTGRRVRTSSTSACSRTATSWPTAPPPSPATTWPIPRRAGQRRRRPHAAAQPVGAGRLGVRAALEDGAGRARGTLDANELRASPPSPARRRRSTWPGRHAPKRISRPRRRCPGSGARHRAEGLAGPRGALPDRAELYGATATANAQFINDPTCGPSAPGPAS